MAGYYDPNKDYSKAISEAKAAGKDTSQLEAERQNKINDKYGGKEPNMWGSDKTYSQASRDNDRDTISNAISISNSRGGNSSNSGSGGSSGGSTDIVKGPGYVTGGYTMGVNGSPILNDNPYWKGGVSASKADMSRRPDLANGYATSNGYTVFYDEDGYAYKTVKGAADYLPHKDYYVEQGSYGGDNLWTDEEMMSAADLQRIASIRAQMQAGQITGDQANQLANQIRSGYGYTIDKQGNVYDSGVGAAIAARRNQWGIDTPVTDAQQQYLQLMFPEQQTTDSNALMSALLALKNGNYDPKTVYTGIQQTGQQYGDLSNGVNLNLGEGYGLNFGSGSYSMDISDASQYLRDMYAQQIAAELASLKSTYEQNVLDYNAQDDLIAQQAQNQRNQAAAQNELQRMYMNEMGIMQGLNTGTTGQMALAQSAALNGSLADIGTQEQQALADSALARAKLKVQYSAAVDQAVAQNNYELANALYNEYVRQDNLAQKAAAAAQEQANWEAKFAYQQQQDALAQQNWQAQFDYKKAQDDLNYQLTLQKLYGENVDSTGSPVKTPSVGYNNGNLTNEQVKVLQNHYGVTADGLWGKNSSNAAGGLTAAQAWDAFQSGPLKSIEQSVGMNRTSTGQANAIQKALQAGSITEAQAEAMLRKFGIM
nr:hypothetical protein [uncultured Oscillibacter sp.]